MLFYRHASRNAVTRKSHAQLPLSIYAHAVLIVYLPLTPKSDCRLDMINAFRIIPVTRSEKRLENLVGREPYSFRSHFPVLCYLSSGKVPLGDALGLTVINSHPKLKLPPNFYHSTLTLSPFNSPSSRIFLPTSASNNESFLSPLPSPST